MSVALRYPVGGAWLCSRRKSIHHVCPELVSAGPGGAEVQRTALAPSQKGGRCRWLMCPSGSRSPGRESRARHEPLGPPTTVRVWLSVFPQSHISHTKPKLCIFFFKLLDLTRRSKYVLCSFRTSQIKATFGAQCRGKGHLCR